MGNVERNTPLQAPIRDLGGQVWNIAGEGFYASTARPTNTAQVAATLTRIARAGSGTLFVPRGTFLMGTPATGTTALAGISNLGIIGEGPGSVLKLADGASNGTMLDLLGFGSGVSNVYIDNLTLDGNGANQTGTSRVILLDGCTNVWIGPNVRIINAKTRSILASNSPRNVTVGGARGRIDARVLGAVGDGHLFSSATVSGSSNQVTVTGATSAMNGLSFEVEQAGAVDALATGWRNLVGYAKYVSSVRLDMYSDSTLLTPLNASHSVAGARAVVATDDTDRLADSLTLSQACGGLVTLLPAGIYYSGVQTLHTGDVVHGDGAGVTFVKAKRGTTPFIAASAGNIQIRGMTIDGFGPDGTATGASFQCCVSLSNVTNVLIEDVTCRNAQVGIAISDQLSSDITLRRVRCENMFTSNGAYSTSSPGGYGVWLFNGPDFVTLEGLVTDGTDRGGLIFDPGTTSETGPTQHDFIDHPTGTNIHISNAARSGISGAVALAGVRYGSFSNVVIDTVGKDPVAGTYSDCGAMQLLGDQNGEYPVSTTVTGLVMKDVGGKAVWIEGVGCHVQGTVDGFNRSQSASSVAPIYIDSYTGSNASGVTIQGPNPSYNTVDLDAAYLDADATKFTHVAVIIGGTAVPDGNGGAGTRTAQALGNVIRGRFVRQGRKYTDGVTNGTTTFTSATAIFSPDDVGKTIRVVGAGTAGGDLFTTIASRNSATSVELTVAATDTAAGHTFYVGNSRPGTGMLALTGGTTNCPSEGPNANVCVLYGVADQAASQIDTVAVAGEAFSRWRRLASGKMDWGGGAATYDTNLYRNSADVLKTDDSLIVGADLTVTGQFAANGASPAARPTYTATNVTTDRSYDANATTTDELADVVGTIIADLRAMGIFS